MKVKNQKLKVKSSGFTLIEAVVATAVFAFVVSSIVGVYLSTFQLDRKTRATQAVAQNGRFILEFLAKEVRNGKINYASYPGSQIPTAPELFVKNQSNEIEHFYLDGTDLVIEKSGSTTNLNSSGVKVSKLKFNIAPAKDPYTDLSYNDQPRVTVILELTSNYGSNQVDVAKLNFQDTFAIRNYPQRQ